MITLSAPQCWFQLLSTYPFQPLLHITHTHAASDTHPHTHTLHFATEVSLELRAEVEEPPLGIGCHGRDINPF